MGDSEKKTQSAPKKEKPTRKTSFFKGVKSEFKKVIWPDKDKAIKETTAVVIVTAVLAVVIAIIDTGLKIGIDKILQIG